MQAVLSHRVQGRTGVELGKEMWFQHRSLGARPCGAVGPGLGGSGWNGFWEAQKDPLGLFSAWGLLPGPRRELWTLTGMGRAHLFLGNRQGRESAGRLLAKGLLQGTFIYTVCVSHSVGSDLRPHGLYPTRLLCPRDSPGKSTGVGCHYLH